MGLRVARRYQQEDAQGRIHADDHHEQVGLVGRAGLPYPSRRPDHRNGIEGDARYTRDGNCDLERFVGRRHWRIHRSAIEHDRSC